MKNKNATKIASLLLAGTMAVSLAACGGQETVTNDAAADSSASSTEAATSEEAAAEETSTRPTEPSGQLVIGTTTQVINEFYDTAFSNSATNYAMYDLIHGGDTVTYTKEGEFAYDETIVASHEETENEDGSKTYTMTINDGLVWSDGSPITAKDYVFELLLENGPTMIEIGYPGANMNVYVGYEEYNEGTTDTFAGVHLIDDMTFSVTVKAEELPYHYDISYAAVRPRPMAVIAPGCDVEDTENGARITGDFTAELLNETVNNIDTGYRYNPQVTCGPYLFAGFDEAAQEATLKVNPKYNGDYRGVKPVIETLVVRTVSSDTMVNELEAGTVDLLFQSSGADTINAGLDLVEEGIAADTTYYRNGYGKIQFDCSVFPTDSAAVRQAIAYCLDRNEFARQYSGGYAAVVNAAYGLAQVEYTENADWLAENLNSYEVNVDTAKELLEADGWNLNADGTPYSGTGTRYKDVDGTLQPLVITWCNSEGNPVSDLLATMLPTNMAEAGMELKATTTDFATLQDCINHAGETTYNMYNLATGFATANSPWYYYSTDEMWMRAGYNSNWIVDQELADASGAMKNIPYEDTEAWMEAWRNYIQIWNEKMPDIPLYSDEYFDFYSTKLHGWEATAIWGWERALLDAWVSE